MQTKLTPAERIQLALNDIRYVNHKKQHAWLMKYEFEQQGKGFESLKEKAYKEFLHFTRLEVYYTSRLHQLNQELKTHELVNYSRLKL